MYNMYMTWKIGRKNMVSSINTLDTTNLYASLNNSKKTSSSADGDADDNKTLIKKLQDKLLENLAESYDKTDARLDRKINEQATSLIKEGDKDKSGGLSLKELCSIDTKDDSDKANAVKYLIGNFKAFDKNGDDQLTITEVKNALKKLSKLDKQFSMQDIAKMAQENNDFSASGSAIGNGQSNLPNSLAEKLISNYQSGDLSSLESSMSVAG